VRAAWWYRRRFYRVLDHNCWLVGAELDLVVRRGRVLAFVEVKSKSGDAFGDPLEMITPVKIARIQRAAEAWLSRNPSLTDLEVRYDVIADRAGRIEHVPGAF
jgi:putative endonuclease